MPISVLLIGHEALTIQCGRMLREAGHEVLAVVSADAAVVAWAVGAGLPVVAPGAALAGLRFDWIVSAANLTLIPAEVLALAARGAVNFHDGPLPAYAGLNAPVWAILAGERSHGVTWHLMTAGVDEGDIVAQSLFDIAPDETAHSLNTKCYAAGVESFAAVIAALEAGVPERRVQDLARRSHFARAHRPDAGGLIDFAAGTGAVLRLVRALDHGGRVNPVALPKVQVAGRVFAVGGAEQAPGAGPVGKVLDAGAALTVATSDGAVRLSGLRALDGGPVDLGGAVGAVLTRVVPDAALVLRLPEPSLFGARCWRRWCRSACICRARAGLSAPLMCPLALLSPMWRVPLPCLPGR
jgi:methionyl-tRNA formyltransferase